ncbi:MAG: hypothetical protein ACRD44_13675 [Bryobacteraceae bacterium]
MVHDCLAGEVRGWSHFVRTFGPSVRTMLAHYGGRADDLGTVLRRLRSSGPALWHDDGLVGDRDFLMRLRPWILQRAGEPPPAEIALELETLAAALEPLTVVERQIAWTETMRYSAVEAARIMRCAPATAEQVRRKAGDLLRASLDRWKDGVVEENGRALQRQAQASPPEDKIGVREFFDIIDGRITWDRLAGLERRLKASWHEIDHFCRIREADDLLRSRASVSPEQEAELLRGLGLEAPKPSFWRRWAGLS